MPALSKLRREVLPSIATTPLRVLFKEATQTRAQNALEQLRQHGKGPAIGFCVSKRHAEFMAEFFRDAGLKAVAVHSGNGSAPRTSSLEALGKGEIDILFAVDMFNEGVDVPEIGTVLMLRPTESSILFLQQLGRGLRKVEDKVLRVIDYIGNHKIFLTKARALLAAGSGDRSLAQRLDDVVKGEADLPPGCKITYDLRALDLLQAMLRNTGAQDEGEAWFRRFIIQQGRRPQAIEFGGAGFNPTKTGHGLWADFLRDMGEAVPDAQTLPHGLLKELKTRPFRMAAEPAVIAALARVGTSKHDDLASEAANVISGDEKDLARWADEVSRAISTWLLTPHIRDRSGTIEFTRSMAPNARAIVEEVCLWRVNQISDLGAVAAAEPAGTRSAPELWHEYMREEIPAFFRTSFNPGSWNAGIVTIPDGLVLLTTLKKDGLTAGDHYEDHFLSSTRMEWQSQTSTKRGSARGKILNGKETKEVHLFVRPTKLRGTKAAPFIYLGKPKFLSWRGDSPITIEWELPQAVPKELRSILGIS